jgi:signal transduction histidine kinase
VHLAITCQRRADWLVLTVQDDGAGLPPEGEMREGTGIGNTRARLAAMFGDFYRLELTPEPTGGTQVRATVPFRQVANAARPALSKASPASGIRVPAEPAA